MPKKKSHDLRLRTYSTEETLALSQATESELKHWLRERVIHPLKIGQGRGGRKFIFRDIALMSIAHELNRFGVPVVTIKQACQSAWLSDVSGKDLFARRVGASRTPAFAERWETFKNPQSRRTLECYVAVYDPESPSSGHLAVIDPAAGGTLSLIVSPLVSSAILVNVTAIVRRLEAATGDRWQPRIEI